MSHAVYRHPRQTGHDGEFWQNMVYWRREWQTTSVFLPWETHERCERYKTEALMAEPRKFLDLRCLAGNEFSKAKNVCVWGGSDVGGHSWETQSSVLSERDGWLRFKPLPSAQDALEKETATHTSMLIWDIPWIEKLRGLPWDHKKVRHYLVTKQQTSMEVKMPGRGRTIR